MGDRVRTVLGTAGVVLTALGVLAVTSPGLVAGTEPLASLVTALSDVGLRSLLLAGCVTLGLVLVRVAWRSSDRTDPEGDDDAASRFEQALAAPPESVTVETARPTAASLDAAFDRAIAGDDVALAGVRDRLAAVATDRLVQYGGDAPATAAEAVAAGTWTADRVVAAFLSDEHGPIHSFGSRLRLWLDPETERRRRLHRTVDAIEALEGRRGQGVPSTGRAGTTQVGGGRNAPGANGGRNSPATGGRRRPRGVDQGRNTPVANGGRSAPVANGGRSAPAATGGRSTPAANGGRNAPVDNSGRDTAATDRSRDRPRGDSGRERPRQTDRRRDGGGTR